MIYPAAAINKVDNNMPISVAIEVCKGIWVSL
jgi:hypothetical protein